MTALFAFRAGATVTRALKTYLTALFSLWTVAVVIVSLRRFILHQHYPFDTLLLMPEARFWDFAIYAPRFAAWGANDAFFTLPGFPFNYPPSLLVSELAYYKLSSAPLYAYLATVILFTIAGGLLVAMAVPKQRRVRPLAIAAALGTAIFSFPLAFLLEQANIEGLVWISASVGLLLFVLCRYTTSAVFLALAASMKIFPGALLLLLLAKRRYRDFCFSLAAIAAITYGSLWIAGPSPSRAAQAIAQGMDHFRQDQIFHFKPLEVGFDHALFALFKQVAFRLDRNVAAVSGMLPHVYLIYGISVILIFAGLYLWRIRRMPVLNQILALSALSILLPFVSYEYTLVHMFAPFAILVLVLAADGATGRLKLSYRKLLLLLLPFAVIFTPYTYLVVTVVAFNGQVKTVALIALIAAAISIPLPSSMFKELPERETIFLNLELDPVEPLREFA